MNNLTKFKYYQNALEANRDKQILAENNILSYIANEQTLQSDWLLSQALGGIELQVFEQDMEKATIIINDFLENEHQKLEVEHTIDHPEFDFVCPKCGSNHLYNDDSSTRFFGISLLGSSQYKCYYCSNEFEHSSNN